MIGTIIDSKYELARLLGEGGMGAVYEGRHLGTGRRVAIKVIATHALAKAPDVVARFQREARASGAIDSVHVVQVLDTGVDPATSSPYMVMEHLVGEDVQNLVQRVGALPADVALRIAAQSLVGLAAAHRAGIVHRDVKSANTFLSTRESGEVTVKLLDFGIAKVRDDAFGGGQDHALTRTGSMLGSPLYMSPEQAKGSKDLDARSDIYSLGATLYETLTGTTPHGECDTLGTLILAICADGARPIRERAPGLAPEVAAVVHRALAIRPQDRYQTALEMHAAVTALLPGGTQIDAAMLNEPARAAPKRTPEKISSRAMSVAVPASPPIASSDASLSPNGATASSFGRTAGSSPTTAKRALVPMALAAVVLIVGIGGAARYFHAGASTPSSVASSSASAAPSTITFPITTASAAPPTVVAEPVAPAASVAAPVASAPSVAKKHSTPPSSTTIAPPTATPAAVPAPTPNCNPNFYYQNGVKRFKEECL